MLHKKTSAKDPADWFAFGLERLNAADALWKEAVAFQPAFAQFASLALELTEDFFSQHYPGEDTTDTGINYPQMRADTEELLKLIKRELPAYF